MSEVICTQALALLTKRVFTLEEIQRQLEAGKLPCTVETAQDGSLTQKLQAQLPGSSLEVVIETSERPWPSVILPHQDFGPYSHDGALERALKFNVNWPQAADVAQQHQGVVLIWLRQNASDRPSPPDALARLMALARITLRIASLPDVAGYFCPGGEVFTPLAVLEEILQASKVAGFPPLDLFANLRLSWLDERWVIFETIGNAQLGLPDFEVYADSEQHDLNEIAAWLRRWSWQHLQVENALADGSITHGPGDANFDVVYADDALLEPKRRVIRLVAHDEAKMPDGLPSRLRIDHA